MKIDITGLEDKWKAKILKTIVNAIHTNNAGQMAYIFGENGMPDKEVRALEVFSSFPKYKTDDALTCLQENGFSLDRISGTPKSLEEAVKAPGSIAIKINFNKNIIDTRLLERDLNPQTKTAVLESLRKLIPESRIIEDAGSPPSYSETEQSQTALDAEAAIAATSSEDTYPDLPPEYSLSGDTGLDA